MPDGKERVIAILVARDGYTEEEAQDLLEEAIEECQAAIYAGDDPEEIWMDLVGLEPDYLLEVLL